MRRSWPLLLLICFGALAGCYSYYAGPKDRPEPVALPASAWPERDAAMLRGLADATPAQLYGVAPNPDEATHESPGGSISPEPVLLYDVVDTRLAAGGLLRVYESRRAKDDFGRFFENLFYGFERNATFISSHWYARFGEQARLDAAETAAKRDEDLRFARPGFRLDRPTPDELLLVGSNISLGVPTEAAGDRGILVHLPALVGNEYEERIVDHLESQGWTVLHVESDTTVRGPNHLERVAASAARSRRQREIIENHPENPLRTRDTSDGSPRRGSAGTLSKEDTELYRQIVIEADAQAAAEIPLPETGFEIHEGDDLEAKARLIAEYVDQHIADHAYAAEAALGFIDESVPALADRPIVVIGFSAGSLAAPTVAARLREQYPGRLAAMVLVGSGAPLLEVARKSTVTDGGLILSPEDGPAPGDETLQELRSLYLERAALDPWNTAATLRDLPVLHVFATRDKIVPTSNARELNDRLGTPDCLVFDGGHLGLFYFLPGQKTRISRWIDRHTESDDE